MVAIMESSDEEEFQDEKEEEMPTGSRKRRASRSAVSYKEDDDDDEEEEEESEDDDDDDDVPLASLKASSPAKKKKAAAAKPKAKAKAKAPAKKKAKTSAPTKSTSSSQNGNEYSSPSFALYGTGSIKGKLIQNLLCRWWYAITWPDPSGIPKEPPSDHDAMDGFPGVFICTQGEEVGTIKDFRDKENSPTFSNLVRKTSEELKELLIKAINEQKRQLVEADGSGTATEKELNTMLKWATKINAKKADKEAEKVFKANKFTIPQ
eukprot:CAMPEP_0116140396 /NCGR_PEP_ID=MMETSP0329-20121206/13821_1 /TAXON_ID=697910 /ORGANISM="Pseudo-nitzschia arenysensis, Strain B593" /LENGTH=263 /DNA_ID=CAMNT_0003635499 /DNA_START=75 /DNA_END=866 /DNA_ORIENTATION=-